MLIALFLVIVKVFYIQVFEYKKLNKLASDLWSRNLEIEADRGKILDRNGVVLSDNLRKGNTQSCGFCGEKSHGNIKISQILDENNIHYEKEKRFNSCKDSSYLPFDFYVNNKYLIEYDGKQHFQDE